MATSASAWPIAIPAFVALDASGVVLAGGKLNTLVAGTSTPLASYPTYADAIAGTNANANPVILSASGAAQVWITATAYKFILTDSNNVTLYTMDNVPVWDVPKSLTTVVKNGNQTSFAAAAKVTTWTLEADALGEWSAGNNRWVALYPGKYLFLVSAEMTDTTINTVLTLSIFKNGAQVGRTINRSSATASQVWGYHAHYAAINVVAGDFFEVFVTGTANTTVSGSVGTRFTVQGVP